MPLSRELDIPEMAKRTLESKEILRVWIAEEAQHVSLRVGIWEDPAAWGIMLSDLINHVANAYSQDGNLDRAKVVKRIRAALEAELSSPTDNPTGVLGLE